MAKKSPPVLMNRRQALMALFAGGVSTLTGCLKGGNFCVLGYSTQPNYDDGIKTVYVPVFRCKAFLTNPYRGMEFQLTRAVVENIESKTPFKVISDPERADTELLGNIIALDKFIYNRNPLNQVREEELNLQVELVWRDLRTQKILSNPRQRQGDEHPSALPAFDPTNPPLPPGPDQPVPVVLTSYGRGVPELGESSTTALKMAVDMMAVKIVSAMEKSW